MDEKCDVCGECRRSGRLAGRPPGSAERGEQRDEEQREPDGPKLRQRLEVEVVGVPDEEERGALAEPRSLDPPAPAPRTGSLRTIRPATLQ